MVKCNKCGADNDDGQKFCSECGAALAEQPAAVPDEAVTEKVCPACGTKNGADEKFCSECGKALTGEAAPTEEAPAPKKEYKNKFVGKVVNVKDKTMAFENKHHLIANVLVAVMAFVFMLVALLAPVKYTMYGMDMGDMFGGGYSAGGYYASIYDDDYDYDDDFDYDFDFGYGVQSSDPQRVLYITVNQSVFNAISAAQAFTIDLKTEAGYNKYIAYMEEYELALEKGFMDYMSWATSHASEVANAMLTGDTDKIIKQATKIYSKALSKVNMMRIKVLSIKYEMLMDEMRSEMGYDDDSGNSGGDIIADLMPVAYNLVMSAIIAIMAIVLAIVSLVYLIKAIIAIVKKTPSDNALFKYIGRAMGIAVSAIALMSVAPELKVGGGMFAIALVGAIIAIIFGTVNALVNNVHKPIAIIKNSIIGVLCTIAFFILCTDIISVKVALKGTTMSVTYGPLGYALYYAFSLLGDMATSGGRYSAYVMGALYSGFVVALIFTAAVASFGSGLAKRLQYNACGLVTRKNGETVKDAYGTRALIAGIVVGIIGILFALAGSPMVFNIMAKSVLEGHSADEVGWPVISFAARAQVYVAVIMVLAAMIFSAVFKPEGKAKPADKPAEETAA